MTGDEKITDIGSRMLGAAVAAVESEPTWPAMAEIPVLITSTQRPCMLLLPVDISDTEVAELAAWMLLNARPWIHRSGSPAGRIIVPGHDGMPRPTRPDPGRRSS